MRRTIGLFFAFATFAWAQSGIGVPTVGLIRDSAGALRRVYGLAGNFLVSELLIQDVRSAAFSGGHALIKTEDRVVVLDQSGNPTCDIGAPEGGALFAVSAERRDAFVLFQSTSEIFRLEGCSAYPVLLKEPDLAGEPLSFASLGHGRLGLIVQRQEDFWLLVLSLSTGTVESETPLAGVSGPILLRPDGTLLFTQGPEVVIRKPDGIERRIVAAAPVIRLSEMGDGWIELLEQAGDGASATHFALRLFADREELYALPEVEP